MKDIRNMICKFYIYKALKCFDNNDFNIFSKNSDIEENGFNFH